MSLQVFAAIDRRLEVVFSKDRGPAKILARRLYLRPQGFPMSYHQARNQADSRCCLDSEIAVWEDGHLKFNSDIIH